jgi:hypothetical protein
MKRVLLACLFLCGCAAKHVSTVDIPKSCFHVNITSFTKPCEEIRGRPGFVTCDKVRAKVDCVKVR